MRARQGAVRNSIAIDVEVAAELGAGFEVLEVHDLAAVELARRVPVERRHQPVVHADVEIHHHEDRRLQPVCEVERVGGEGEGFVRVLREQQNVLGIPMRGVGGGEDVGLLRAGRHAGRWAAALDVEDDRRDLGEIRQPDEFLHQRDAGPGGRSKRAGAVPGSPDHHADRRQLVLCLDNGVAVLLRLGVAAQPMAMRGEGLGQR